MSAKRKRVVTNPKQGLRFDRFDMFDRFDRVEFHVDTHCSLHLGKYHTVPYLPNAGVWYRTSHHNHTKSGIWYQEKTGMVESLELRKRETGRGEEKTHHSIGRTEERDGTMEHSREHF